MIHLTRLQVRSHRDHDQSPRCLSCLLTHNIYVYYIISPIIIYSSQSFHFPPSPPPALSFTFSYSLHHYIYSFSLHQTHILVSHYFYLHSTINLVFFHSPVSSTTQFHIHTLPFLYHITFKGNQSQNSQHKPFSLPLSLLFPSLPSLSFLLPLLEKMHLNH